MRNIRAILQSLVPIALAASVFLSVPEAAFSEADPVPVNSEAASQAYPPKRKSKGTTESLLSLPGRLLSIPVDMVLTASGAVTGWLDDNRIPQRMRELTTFRGGQLGVRFKYSAEEGVGPDFFLKDLFNEGSRVHLTATAGMRGRQSYRLAMSRVRLGTDRVIGGFRGGYLKYPDEVFFGIGPDSDESMKMDYLFESAYLEADVVASMVGGIRFLLGAGIENNSVADGRDSSYPGVSYHYEPGELPGVTGGLGLAHLRAGLYFNNIAESRVGTLVSVSGDITTEIGGEEYGFIGLVSEVSQRLPLFHDRYLILRAMASLVEPADGREIPFYRLSEIGRRETIRGYPRGRFRDRDMLVCSIEYHFPVWKQSTNRLETFIFSDAGQVANDIRSEIDRDDIKLGFGGGLVLFGSDGEMLRSVAGLSREGWRLYFVWH